MRKEKAIEGSLRQSARWLRALFCGAARPKKTIDLARQTKESRTSRAE
jgi:hypothetical protein